MERDKHEEETNLQRRADDADPQSRGCLVEDIPSMSDDIDKLITDIIQHANAVSQTSERDKPIMEWKSYPKMREAVADWLDERLEDERWHRTIGDE